MQQQRGFTLIELIIVIVILGILAVTAAPKFMDIQGDAKASVVKGMAGAMKTASDIIHAKSLINGNSGVAADPDKPTVAVNANDVNIDYGYADVLWAGAWVHMLDADIAEGTAGSVCTGTEFCVFETEDANGSGDAGIFIYPKNTADTGACYAYYSHASAADTPPGFGTVTTDC
jgi:MSHA pilin protein MshA